MPDLVEGSESLATYPALFQLLGRDILETPQSNAVQKVGSSICSRLTVLPENTPEEDVRLRDSELDAAFWFQGLVWR